MNLMRLRIQELLIYVASGRCLPEDLIQAYYRRLVQFKHLNAFISHVAESDLPTLKRPVRRVSRRNGLSSIPFAIKDNFCSKRFGTTCASRMLDNFRPTYNATVIERCERHGAVLFGKTNMDEFAMGSGSVDSIYGRVRNPYNDAHIAGGSSGGAACAVSVCAVPFAIGSDTAGSVRNPAAYCGVVGYRPTYGTLSRHGLIPLVNSMDVPGIFARYVDDAAYVYDLAQGRDDRDSTSIPNRHFTYDRITSFAGIKIGFPSDWYDIKSLSKDVRSAWDDVLRLVTSLGAKLVETPLPLSVRYANACYSVLCAVDVASNMSRYDGVKFGYSSDSSNSSGKKDIHDIYAETRKAGFSEVVQRRIAAGNYFLLRDNVDDYFTRAAKVRRLITDEFSSAFKSCDFIVAPVTLTDAPHARQFQSLDNRAQCEEQDLFTTGSSLAGLPAISIPTSFSSRGLPIGIQILSKRFDDAKLLSVASLAEKGLDFNSEAWARLMAR